MSQRLVGIVPDSSLLIAIGLIIGGIMRQTSIEQNEYQLASFTFFMFLLPPIVFDAGYFMPNRAFWNNLGTILVYAVIGTIWNMIAIGMQVCLCWPEWNGGTGFCLYGVGMLGAFTTPVSFLHVHIREYRSVHWNHVEPRSLLSIWSYF
jgi:NhaP-type Na+/H+ or K+/H+ antiporter